MVNELVELISTQARRFGDREALRFRDYKTQEWMSISWNQFKTNIEREAKSLYKAGLDVEDKVAIFSQNCPEILTTHFATTVAWLCPSMPPAARMKPPTSLTMHRLSCYSWATNSNTTLRWKSLTNVRH